MATITPATAANESAVAATDTPADTTVLWQQITERYDCAQQIAAANMMDTKTEVLSDGDMQFVIRVAARLRDKPKAPSTGARKEFCNPFLPYEQALWVANLGDSHVLLLNKFNIVPWHCLVVTAEFHRQEEDLDAGDLAATWRVMQSMPHGGLAFYNCGPASGASQPHKHLQIVPLPLDDSHREGAGSSSSSGIRRPPIWPAVLEAAAGAQAGQPVELRNIPFAAFAATLDPPQPAEEAATGQYLLHVYRQLLDQCRAFVSARTGQESVSPSDGSLSYNLVLTSEFMLLVPRRAEAVGPVSCNSVAFAGSIFVKSREEQQYVEQQGPLHILTAVGFDW